MAGEQKKFLRNLTGRAVLPRDKKIFEKFEAIFKRCAEVNRNKTKYISETDDFGRMVVKKVPIKKEE